jgi:multiple antibiotic resistance protein
MARSRLSAIKRHRSWLLPSAILLIAIGLTASAAVAQGIETQYERQIELLRQKFEVFGGPSLKNVVVILFLSIGPLGVIPAFAKLTSGADAKLKRRLAFRGFWISAVTITAVALVGTGMVANYRVSLHALLTAAGLILAIVAGRSILAVYFPRKEAGAPAEPLTLSNALTPLSFPIILPPHGIAVVLLLMVIGTRIGVNTNLILGIILTFMVLDFVGMLFAKQVLKVLRPQFLQVLGVILSVIKLAIGLTWIYAGIALGMGSIRLVTGP